MEADTKTAALVAIVEDEGARLRNELMQYSTNELAAMKQGMGGTLKTKFSQSLESFNRSLADEHARLMEAIERLDAYISDHESLRNFSVQYIEDLLNMYETAADSMHQIYKDRAEELQRTFQEELADCQARYEDRAQLLSSLRKAVATSDILTDSNIQATRSQALDTLRNEASVRLNALSYPSKIAEIQSGVVQQENDQKEDILERRKRLNHLKMHAPREDSYKGSFKMKTARYAQELSSLKDTLATDTALQVIEKLKAEKKYVLESLKGIKSKINRELDFYKGKLIQLAHNAKNASDELSETRDRLENIRRLHALCEKLSVSLDLPRSPQNSMRENVDERKFKSIDESNAVLLTHAVSLETQTSAMNSETMLLKEGLIEYLRNSTIDNEKFKSWLLHHNLVGGFGATHA